MFKIGKNGAIHTCTGVLRKQQVLLRVAHRLTMATLCFVTFD
jgi:hypothetical protein